MNDIVRYHYQILQVHIQTMPEVYTINLFTKG